MANSRRPAFAVIASLVLCMGGIALQQASAAPTEIANIPVAGTGLAAPKPNVMLLMDTSKSMSFTHMPDELENTAGYQQPIGYRSAQCNSLYYDPNKTYTVPKDAGQRPLATPSFQAARYNYYSASDTSLVDLSTSFRAYDRNTLAVAIADTREDAAQPAYYYVYTGSGAGSLKYFSAPCTDQEADVFAGADFTQTVSRNTTYVNSAGASVTGTWRRVRVSTVSGPGGIDETTNFAIWYTYYRTRMAMVKSSVSSAFAPLTDKFRIGFISMNPLNDPTRSGSGVARAKYLAIDDFTDVQKSAWYSKIYSQEPNGSSPAREGLARVGRHYAGKFDGINTDMTPDPVKYSCQQNFTIMTTDGYWNTAQETVGPVKIDGTTLVGNQDGVLTPKTSLERTDNTQYSHRPIWDGTTSGTRTDTNRMEQKRYQSCDSGEFYKTTSIIRMSTSQTLQRSQALTVSTSQTAMSTRQTSKSTSQTQMTTASVARQTLQQLASTQQTTRSTRQEFRRTVFYTQGTSTTTASTSQVLQTTSYTEKRQTTLQSRTTQNIRTASRMLQSTSQRTRSTLQYKVSTSQRLKTETTYYRSTTTTSQATSQSRQTTTRRFQRTSQLVAYNGATEQAVPVASCTQTGTISCLTLVTGPTAVASCTPQSASASNNFLAITCDTPTVVGPTPVQSCTPAAASSSNNFTATTCDTQTTGPTVVANCTPAAASAGNNWTATTCTPSTSAETQVASCTPGTSGTVTTNCRTVVLSSDVPVQSCNAGTSGTTATSCRTATTGPTPIGSCATSSASSSNSWMATTCTPTTTGPTGVSSCTDAVASAGNNWTQTTCNTVTTGPTAVASCTPSTAGTGNSWTATSCTADASVASTGPVQSCTSQTPNAGNGFIKVDCTVNQSAWVNNGSCSTINATAGNNWTATSCQSIETMAATPVLPANCSAGTSGAVTTTCTSVVLTDVPVASCTRNTTGPSFVSCRTVTTGPTAVASCTPSSATAANNWVATTCNTTTTPGVNVQSCTPVAAGPGNGNVATTCATSDTTLAVAPGSCVPQTASAANNWVTISCPAAQTTGPTGVPLNSCTSTPATAANSWVETSCATTGPTVPAPVQSCTSGTNSSTYVVTTCTSNNGAVQTVAPGACTPVAASAGNQWTQTACTPSSSTVSVPAGSCTPSAAGVVPVVTCASVTTGPTFVADGSCSAGTDNNYLTTTCSTATTGPTFVSSCTAGTDASFKVTSCRSVTTGPTQLALNATCNSEAPSASNNWKTTTCTPSDVTVGVAAGTCTPSAPGVLPVVTCQTNASGPTAVAACTAGTGANFLETSCQVSSSAPERTTSCTPAAASAANGYQSTTCDAIPGTKIQVKTLTTTTTYTVSGTNPVAGTGSDAPTVETPWTDLAGGMCYPAGAALPVIDTSTSWQQSTDGFPAGCTAWPCKGQIDPGTAVRGSLNSLADVAQYYYVTDLRGSAAGVDPDPWRNDVPKLGSGIEDDRAPWQHMTTFVLGLGVSGTLNFRADYKSALTGDFTKIRSYENQPALNWPVWPTSEPMPTSLDYNDGRSIDDFWHTAVNGRGKFFAANDPDSVVNGLKEALAGISAQAGAGAGAATSTLTPVAGDNIAYTGSYTSAEWTGDLKAEDINLSTGNLSGTVKWSARTLLDQRVGTSCDNRKIYVREPSSGALVDFTWNTNACDSSGSPTGASNSDLPTALRTHFTSSSVIGHASTSLSQYALMSDAQRTAALGARLVNFIRGQKSNEGFVANDADKLYRSRTHALGDIVNSQPTYVRAPSLNYQDAGYSAFKSANASRTPMVYVGANDGMLHAFYAPAKSTDPNYAKAGQEAWAYIPTSVMPNLYKLADMSYSEKHAFFVDATVTSGDVYDAAAARWRSIIVGGLGAGGKGYYAIDVTDGASPRALWEFNFTPGCSGNPVGASGDCNVGLTFGRPVITKLKNGKWVVMVTSGYNNITGAGADGKGYLYVLDAVTGGIISRIATSAGTTATPSGLRELNFFVSNIAYDNTALRAYGADVLGNIWRFDINDTILPAGLEATLIGTAKDANGTPQPITTRPELAEVSGNTMVLVGTGKLLATGDLSDTSGQSVYAIKDPLSAASPVYENLRTALPKMEFTQTGSGATATRSIACALGTAATGTAAAGTTTGATAVDCSSDNGWFVDLPDGGERVNVDMQTVLGTLVFVTNIPSDTMCLAGGYSWLNYVNLINGQPVATSPNGVSSVPFFANSLVVGMGLVGLGDGSIRALGRSREDETTTLRVPVGSPPPLGKRISWREITH